MKSRVHLFFIGLLLFLTVGQAGEPALTSLTEWYVDAINGDDESGVGSEKKPFKSIHALLAGNDVFSRFVNEGDTIYLAAGKYDAKPVLIDIPKIKIKGTLGEDGMPSSILCDVKITADGVSLTYCLFLDAELTLQGAEAVAITNNLFSGKTKDSLTLIGSSKNRISGNSYL